MESIPFFKRKRVIISLITLAAVVVLYLMFWPKALPLEEQYLTEPVEQGELIRSVSANGTISPVSLINVGTQVSGVVKKIHADFNDKVKKGQILLELDGSLSRAQLAQSKAMVDSALASYELASSNMKRTQTLYDKEYVAKQDLDTAMQVMKSAKAQLDQARAQAERDRINLEYTVIRSPVAGVVVSREVDVGQTVAASFQTPTLFQIAQDMTRMQIDSSFAEADIGSIKVGQETSFTVDAFQNREFRGVVRQLRLNPTTQQNVVTYNVVIDVDNDDGILLPGMTAYVSVVTARLQQVIKVPNAALRFRPAADAVIESRDGEEKRTEGGIHATVYKLGKTGLLPVRLELGGSDNNYTEVKAGDLKVGEPVVVDRADTTGSAKHSARVRIH